MNIDHSGFVVIGKIRAILSKKGCKLLRSLGCYIEGTDLNRKPRYVSQNELMKSLAAIGVSLNHDDTKALIKSLNTGVDNQLDYDKFVEELRGRMNQRRQEIVDNAFMKFDPERTGCITVRDLQGNYNFKMHPKVQCGEWSESDVFQEFIDNFYEVKKAMASNVHQLASNIEIAKISRTEFDDYYSVVSMMVEDDELFCDLMRSNWKL